MEIYWLGEWECHDAKRVGGKAASLSRLCARWPAPGGFCLSFALDTNGEADVDRERVDGAYCLLCERAGVARAAVAVRSSAVDEDGQQVSFAGQHESYLNLHGSEAVLAGVRRCLDSMRSERALSYRRQHGLGMPGRAAVLVQHFVRADVSAVVFSADPCSGRRGKVVVNATYGLGESLVSGTVTPDLYVVDKETLQVETCLVAEKACMTVAVEQGTREIATPRMLRGEPALEMCQVIELTRLAIGLEVEQGWPVDLECSYEAGRLYLLQCRPITTLARAEAVVVQPAVLEY